MIHKIAELEVYRKSTIQTIMLTQDEHLNQQRKDSLPYLNAIKSFLSLLQQASLKPNSQVPSAMKRTVHPDHFMTPWSAAEMSKAEDDRKESKYKVCKANALSL